MRFNLYSISCMSYKSSSLWSSINLSYTLTTIRKNYYLLITIFKCPLHTDVCIINIINTTQTSSLLMSSSIHRYEIQSAFISTTLLEEFDVPLTVHHSIDLFQITNLMHNSCRTVCRLRED